MKVLNLPVLVTLVLLTISVQATPKADSAIDIKNEGALDSADLSSLGAVKIPSNAVDQSERVMEVPDNELPDDARNSDDEELALNSFKWSRNYHGGKGYGGYRGYRGYRG